MLTLVAGILTAGSAPANAASTAVPTDTCGGSVYVAPDTDVTSNATGTPIARIQLRRDSNYYYWSCITFFSPVPAGHWGMARLYRVLDGILVDNFHCDSGGGTNHVEAGYRFCRTPKILALSSRVTFRAEGNMYQGLSNEVAHGVIAPHRR